MRIGAWVKKTVVTMGLSAFCIVALLGLGAPASASKDGATAPAAAEPLDPLIILGVEPAPGEEVDQQFLQPDEAFRLSTEVLGPNTIIARWRIANTYYMYRNKFRFSLPDSVGIQLENVSLPPGKIKTDVYFGRVEVYFKYTEALITLNRNSKETTDLKLEVGYQGCTELGLCYPPITRKISLTLPSATE